MTELTITNCVKALKAVADCVQSKEENVGKYNKVKEMILDLLCYITPGDGRKSEDEICAKCDELKEYAQAFNDEGDNLIIKRSARDLATIFRKVKANEYDDFFNALANAKGAEILFSFYFDELDEEEQEQPTPQELYDYACDDYKAEEYQKARMKAEKSLEGGFSGAAFLLGLIYEEGKGVALNLFTAFKYYLKGAQMDNPVCQYYLSLAYKEGKGCIKDAALALKWLKTAAENGDTDAMTDWGYHCCAEIDPPRFSEGFDYFSKAAERGHSRAKLMLALCYENGWGVKMNLNQAKSIYKELMAVGNQYAKEAYNRILEDERHQEQEDKQNASAAKRKQEDEWLKQEQARAEAERKRIEEEKRKKNERFGCGFWIVILALIAIGYGGYRWWYLPYKIDKEAPRTYVFANNLFLRSSKVADVEYNRVGKIPYGSELITYSNGDGWAEIKVNGQKGFVASAYLLDYNDFHLLNGVWGNNDAQETIITAKCRLAILDYLKRNNLKSGNDGWMIFTKPSDVKPNAVLFPRLANGYENFTDFAFLLKNNVTNDRKLVVYSFEENETPVLVYEENAPFEGDIKKITYTSWSKKYRVTYSGKQTNRVAQSQSGVRQQVNKVTTGRLEVRNVNFADVDLHNNIRVPYDHDLYSDMQYLKAQVFFVVGDYSGKSIMLQIKIYTPSMGLIRGSTSPEGYTFQEQVSITGDSNEIKKMILMGWGNQTGTFYTPGEYKYEIWSNGEKLYSTKVKVYEKKQGSVELGEDKIVYEAVDQMPEFSSGGMKGMAKFLSMYIKYPTAAQEKGLQGCVTVQFVVEKDGSIKDAKVLKSVDPLLDKEALRVINLMPNWKPGKKNGVTVRVRYVVPVLFKLS